MCVLAMSRASPRSAAQLRPHGLGLHRQKPALRAPRPHPWAHIDFDRNWVVKREFIIKSLRPIKMLGVSRKLNTAHTLFQTEILLILTKHKWEISLFNTSRCTKYKQPLHYWKFNEFSYECRTVDHRRRCGEFILYKMANFNSCVIKTNVYVSLSHLRDL